jgi:AcrR family transcriptional regulator
MAEPTRDRAKPASRTSTKSRRARGSLSEEEILEGAKELVERYGLHELSMPALARQLNSGVTSIYWYFRSKDDLLQALTDQVTREMYRALPPVGDGPWDEELIEYFAVFRDLLADTPIYREVFAYRPRLLFVRAAMGRSMLRRLEAGLHLLTSAGLTPEQAADAFNACSNYTRGFGVLEHGLPSEDADETETAALHRFDPEEFPTLSQLEDFEHVMWLDDEQFRVGLRLLVEGIRHTYGL